MRRRAVLLVVLLLVAGAAWVGLDGSGEEPEPGAAYRDDVSRIEVWQDGQRTVINASDPGYERIRDTGVAAIAQISGTAGDRLANCTTTLRETGAVQIYFDREVGYRYGGYLFRSDTFTLSTTAALLYRSCTGSAGQRDVSPLLVSDADWLSSLRAGLEQHGYR